VSTLASPPPHPGAKGCLAVRDWLPREGRDRGRTGSQRETCGPDAY